ncbi:MAG: Ig-like domain-containing protein [Anaerolineae bacterium]|nr:Ig-like domain-containing protein [Anaerolineae bacterium]
MSNRRPSIWIIASVFLIIIGGLVGLPGAASQSALAQPLREPDIPADELSVAGSSDPISIVKDAEGYTVWTYEYPDAWCVMYSRIRWPFELGGQDPSDLSETSLRLTFSEHQYVIGPEGESLYTDPTWAVALNGNPGAWTDGSFTGDWNIIGVIGAEPTLGYTIFVEQEIPFDYTELIDGENNLWFQQQDFCGCAGLADCACTCYELNKIQLRAMVKLGVKHVSPEPDTRNIRVNQQQDSDIRVLFTTLVSETTVNENTFQVYYLDAEKQPVYVPGQVRKLSNVEYSFVPDAPLKDGVRYEARVWGETDALGENYNDWIKDLNGGPLETGMRWSFWTLPQLQVRLEPVQVLEDEVLITYKPTVLRVFLSSANFYTDVWYLDVWQDIQVDNIELTWRSPSGAHHDTVSWRTGSSDWQFAYAPKTALRKRIYDKFEKLASQDSVNYFGFMPEETGYYWIRAVVTVLDNHGEKQSFTTLVTPDVIQTRWLNLHSRALAVGADYGKTGTANLSDVVMGNRSGIQAIYPVQNVRLAHAASAIPYYDPVASLVWSNAPAGDYQLVKVLTEMSALCAASSGCDFMVGYAPAAWLVDIGLTLPELAWSGALVENSYADLYRFVVAHEGGHLYGFEHDTYQGGQGYDVRNRADRRVSTARMEPQTAKTLKQINSFMNIDPVESPPPERLWIEWRNYRSLLSRFTTTSQSLRQTTLADSLLLVTGAITPATGAVDLDPWYRLEPGDWQEPTPGPYRIMFLDGAGQEIAGYTHSFTVATTLQPASGPTRQLSINAPAPFALKIPYPATMTRIQIRRNADDALLGERVLSTSAPSISITLPVSTTWSGTQTIAWQTDPDETRYFAVLISTDNGATWEAQAIHWPNTVYTIETASMPNSTQAMIRVIATDGLNTASDTAGPFTIDNPQGVDYVSPVPGAVYVNVEQPLYAGFRDAMDPTTFHSGTFMLSGGPYGTVPGTVSYDAESHEATFIPKTRLAYSTTYTARVSAAIRTLDGSTLSEDVIWNFTTEADFTPPRPRLLSPLHGALHVARNTAVAVTWDRVLDTGAITTKTFQMATIHGATINGNVTTYITPGTAGTEADVAVQTAIFTPITLLAPHTTYVVTLTAGITDTRGNATITPTVWFFTTGDATPALALTGSYADSGVDADGDNLYEQLIIHIGVQVTATGSYVLRGSLVDTAGGEITWTYMTQTLSAGFHFLDLLFDGTTIGGHGVDGPYTLTDLTLTHTDGALNPTMLASTSKQDAYRTFAYPADRFPALLTFTGLPDVQVIPGITFLNAFNVHDYAHHATLASDQLSYTVMLDTDPTVGVALQSSGEIHITPESYWQGETQVTVRASDGAYAVQDTFEVVVGWPHALYLPVVLRNSSEISVLNVRSAQVTFLEDDFESGITGWSRVAWISTPPDGPGGWYWWDTRDCRAYSGEYSAWPYGGNDDGELLACGAEYPNTLNSTMYKIMPVNLKYVSQGAYSAKVWTNLAPGDEICLKVAVLDSGYCQNDYGWQVGDYYGVCRSGQTDGWENLTLDLADVPTLGNVLGQERVCLSVDFQANETESRPEGVYVDDVNLLACPEGLTGYCASTSALPVVQPDISLVAGNIGSYPEDVSEVAVAVDATGRVHVLWTGKLNPSFETYVFYSSSTDGVNWTPYQILNYWGGRDPQITVDNVHQRVHLVYANTYDGIIHHTVVNGVPSSPVVVAPHNHYFLPNFSLQSGGVAWPSLTVAEESGYAYLLWREAYFVRVNDYTYSLRYRTWHAYWNGNTWSTPLRKINDQDTQYSTIVAAPDDQVMMAWFQRWDQSSGDGLGPGDPIVARTAYGTEPGSLPLRQATHDLYPEPERDESILLAYSGGDDTFVLASDHAMWPGHSRAYRYVWKDGTWSEPLSVAENTSGWALPVYVGAAMDTSLIHYVYSDDGSLKMRTETEGVLSAAQLVLDYLTTHGYSNCGSPLAYFTDPAGKLHMVVNGEKNGVAGFYYVKP